MMRNNSKIPTKPHGNSSIIKLTGFKINKKSAEKKSEKKTVTFARLLTVFSIVGTGLASIGFGVSMAVNDVLSLPHETLFSSTLDLIQLSIWGISQFINGLVGIKSIWPAYVDFIINMASPAWFLFLCVTTYVIFGKRITPIINWVRKYASRIKEKTIIPKKEDSKKTLILKCAGFASIWTIGVSILFFAFFFVTIIVSGVLIFTTTAGLQAGYLHIQQYVIAPQSCRPLRTREERLKKRTGAAPSYADCVAVSSDRRNLGRGRLVFATATSVVLFDPKSGTTWRIPTKDAVVETVDTLDETPSLVRAQHVATSRALVE
ncbi:hypothetical protein ACWYXN_06100 [Janthinobacterium aestuarii]